MFRALGINSEDLPYNPFAVPTGIGFVPLYGVPARSVTPAMVADALERLGTQKKDG